MAGSFGIIDAVGALAAAVVGSIAARTTPYRIILYAVLIMLLSWGAFYGGGYTYAGLIIGIVLIDLGLQSMHNSSVCSRWRHISSFHPKKNWRSGHEVCFIHFQVMAHEQAVMELGDGHHACVVAQAHDAETTGSARLFLLYDPDGLQLSEWKE